MPANSPHALLLLLIGALLAASATTSPVAAGDRMVIAHAASRTASDAGSVTWRRRLEDEVAPEFPVGGLLGGEIGYGPLEPRKAQCVQNCAAKGPGSSYTRPCTYKEKCTQGHD